MIVYGINPVIEALRAGRVKRLWIAGRRDERMQRLLAFASTQGIEPEQVTLEALVRRADGGLHQGVVADVDDTDDYSLAQVVEGASGTPLVVVLDGVEDPHNLGAILRTADASGASGVVVQTRRSAARSGAAVKASAGAAAHVKIAEVVNIARAIEELKGLGVWTVGLAGDAQAAYDAVDMTVPVAIVLGAEGTGLRRLVRERCDFLASIPMSGHVGSLNVSVAAGVVLFEALRQRRQRGDTGAAAGGRPNG